MASPQLHIDVAKQRLHLVVDGATVNHIYVGRLLGAGPLAAMASFMPLFLLLSAFIFGLGARFCAQQRLLTPPRPMRR